MGKVVFSFGNEETIIECDFKDKMKDIFMKYCSKVKKDIINYILDIMQI